MNGTNTKAKETEKTVKFCFIPDNVIYIDSGKQHNCQGK